MTQRNRRIALLSGAGVVALSLASTLMWVAMATQHVALVVR